MIDTITPYFTLRSAAILTGTAIASTTFPKPFNFGSHMIRLLGSGIGTPLFGKE